MGWTDIVGPVLIAAVTFWLGPKAVAKIAARSDDRQEEERTSASLVAALLSRVETLEKNQEADRRQAEQERRQAEQDRRITAAAAGFIDRIGYWMADNFGGVPFKSPKPLPPAALRDHIDLTPWHSLTPDDQRPGAGT